MWRFFPYKMEQLELAGGKRTTINVHKKNKMSIKIKHADITPKLNLTSHAHAHVRIVSVLEIDVQIKCPKIYQIPRLYLYIDGLVQDCSNSIANALELLQPCTKPSIWRNKPMLPRIVAFRSHVLSSGLMRDQRNIHHVVLHIEIETDWSPLCRLYFQVHFCWTCVGIWLNFTEILFGGI